MWRLGFFLHEMGFGLLSIFLPLYVVSIAANNGLYYIGIMSALALFVAIPASFFWGYVCDRTRRYKRYILLSFLASGIFLYVFTLSTGVVMLILLYVSMAVFHVAHEAPKNVLISESYSRQDWERTFAFYEGFTETGWLIGLLLGFFTSTYGFSPSSTLLLCSGLNLAAFVASLFLVADPLLIFERRLVSIERTLDFAHRGVFLASKFLDGISTNQKLKKENVGAFFTGLILFSLATSILFTPMPIFVSGVVQASFLPASVVFAIFLLNSCGAVAGYLFAGNRSGQSTDKARVSTIVIFRSLLAFLLIAVLSVPVIGLGLTSTVLILMNFLYAFFLTRTLSLSMELIPAGKSGLFNVLIGAGGALGSFIGPFIAQAYGFLHVFAIAGGLFFLAFIAFRLFR
jgi:MFS family permease